MPQGVEPSNLEKVFWPEAGLTKGDLRSYLEAVSPYLLPALRGRPLTVIRYPDGIHGMRFYQKNTPKYAPEWIETVTIHAGTARRDVRYTVCNSTQALLWLGNQAAIEFHPWLSRVARLERPDYLVFDLDPPEGRFEMAAEAARIMRHVLDRYRLEALLKTSGAKGIHLFVPLERRYDYAAVRTAADRLAAEAASLEPDVVTTAFHIAERGGRVFLDTGRVAPGAHVVAVYSPRARDAASVSFPFTWDELSTVRPEDYTIRNVPGALRRGGDRWKQLMPTRQRLPARLID